MTVQEGSEQVWTQTTIRALGRLHCGQSPASKTVNDKGEGTPYVSGPEQWDGYTIHQCKWTTAPARIAPASSIFITVKGAGVGTLFPGIKAAIGRDIYAFEPHPSVDFGYVYRALQFSIQDVIAKARGDIPGLSKDHILDHPISFPGVRAQRRIASKIDELFSRIEEGDRALGRARQLVRRYRNSVLKSAVIGELTRKWRGERTKRRSRSDTGSEVLERILKHRREAWERAELAKMKAKGISPADEKWRQKYQEPIAADTGGLPELPEGWVWASLDAVADVVGGLTVDKKRTGEDLEVVPYLRVANVQRGYLDLAEIKSIKAAKDRVDHLRLQPGDILFNEGGDLDKLGRGWIWEGQISRCIHQNHVFRARLFVPGAWNKIISWYGNVLGRELFMNMGKQTTNLASLSLSKLKSLPIPVMGEREAEAIVSLVEDVLSIVDKQREDLAIQARTSRGLRQAVLKLAFSGHLVSEDAEDEPASELLARIASGAAERTRTLPQSTSNREPA